MLHNLSMVMENINLSDKPFYIKPFYETSNKSLKLRRFHKHVCRICDKEFKQSGHLDTHIKLKHSSDKPFYCNFPGCDKSFAVKWAARSHMKIHSEKKHCCNFCDNKFHQKFQMESHIKFVHLGMSYDCKICGKRFENKYLLKYHLEKHK